MCEFLIWPSAQNSIFQRMDEGSQLCHSEFKQAFHTFPADYDAWVQCQDNLENFTSHLIVNFRLYFGRRRRLAIKDTKDQGTMQVYNYAFPKNMARSFKTIPTRSFFVVVFLFVFLMSETRRKKFFHFFLGVSRRKKCENCIFSSGYVKLVPPEQFPEMKKPIAVLMISSHRALSLIKLLIRLS